MQEVLTLREAASYLRISHSTLYKLVERNRIPASKVGGGWRFRKDSLDGWLGSSAKSLGSVLVVDDEPNIRDLLSEIVSRQGYSVVGADSGESAVQEMDRKHFDLVFLDLVLPGLSGIDVIKRLKAKGERTVVTVITGHGDDPIAMQAMTMGPLMLIHKPFRIEDVVRVLDIVMTARV